MPANFRLPLLLAVAACFALPATAAAQKAGQAKPTALKAAAAERPLDPAAHPSRAGVRIALSLRNLQEEARRKPVSAEALNLGGIGWLEGFVIDRAGGDVILLGRRVPGWPGLHLDDFVVNLRNVSFPSPPPACSLDPRPENVLLADQLLNAGMPKKRSEFRPFLAKAGEAFGPQMTVVSGVPRESRHARVMIEADYRMKKLAFGLETLPGLSSTLDLMVAAARAEFERSGKQTAGNGASSSRFWFQLGDNEPTVARTENALWLARCDVRILTERQRTTATGALVDAGGEVPAAREFARQLTERYDQAAAAMPEFADLANLFRLSALLRVLQMEQALRQTGLDFGYVLSTYAYRAEAPLPASLPALFHSRELELRRKNMIYFLSPMIMGGVSMQMRPTLEQVGPAAVVPPRPRSAPAAVTAARPAPSSLWWLVPE